MAASDPRQIVLFETLQRWLKESGQKISFDPFRWLEYASGGLIPVSPFDMLETVLPAIMEFRDQIAQLRLYDFVPFVRLAGLVPPIAQERRLLPREGIFP